MRKQFINVKANDLTTGDRFVLGSKIYHITLIGKGEHSKFEGYPDIDRKYVLIGALAESGPNDYVSLELKPTDTFEILKK